MKIIVIPDDHYKFNNIYTALIYDFIKNFTHIIDKVDELDIKEFKDKGRSTFRPFGVDYDKNYIYIVSHNRIAKFCKHTYKYVGIEHALTKKLGINTHYIRKKNNTFYVTNTASDNLAILNKEEDKYVHIPTRAVLNKNIVASDVNDKDTVHINSFCIRNNLLYYCLHNKGVREARYEVLDLNTNEITYLFDAGWCSHGVEVINSMLYSLSSGTGELIEHDLETKNTRYYKLVNAEETFLRGLDIFGMYLYIGCSNPHFQQTLEDNCYIIEFNTNNKEAKKFLSIPDMLTIADLRILI